MPVDSNTLHDELPRPPPFGDVRRNAHRVVLISKQSHNPSNSLIPQLFVKSKVRGSLATALISAQEKFPPSYLNLKCKLKFLLTRFRPKSREIFHIPYTVPCKFSYYRLSVIILSLNLLFTYFLSQISLYYLFPSSRPSKKLPSQSTSMKNYYDSLQDNSAEGMDFMM